LLAKRLQTGIDQIKGCGEVVYDPPGFEQVVEHIEGLAAVAKRARGTMN